MMEDNSIDNPVTGHASTKSILSSSVEAPWTATSNDPSLPPGTKVALDAPTTTTTTAAGLFESEYTAFPPLPGESNRRFLTSIGVPMDQLSQTLVKLAHWMNRLNREHDTVFLGDNLCLNCAEDGLHHQQQQGKTGATTTGIDTAAAFVATVPSLEFSYDSYSSSSDDTNDDDSLDDENDNCRSTYDDSDYFGDYYDSSDDDDDAYDDEDDDECDTLTSTSVSSNGLPVVQDESLPLPGTTNMTTTPKDGEAAPGSPLPSLHGGDAVNVGMPVPCQWEPLGLSPSSPRRLPYLERPRYRHYHHRRRLRTVSSEDSRTAHSKATPTTSNAVSNSIQYPVNDLLPEPSPLTVSTRAIRPMKLPSTKDIPEIPFPSLPIQGTTTPSPHTSPQECLDQDDTSSMPPCFHFLTPFRKAVHNSVVV